MHSSQLETGIATNHRLIEGQARFRLVSAEERDGDIWASVDRLIDGARCLSDLRAHRLHLLAARRWRALGRPVPEDLIAESRTARLFTLVASAVLEQARAAYDGPMMLMKGLEAAALYPDPALRPFRDVDLLVPDAAGAQRALISAGFQPVGNGDAYYAARHHLRPLCWPGMPLVVEIHRRPQWPTWTPPPSNEELFSAAVPASAGVDGVLTLAPSHHALVLAAHSWSEAPLRRALDLVDVAAVSAGQDRRELYRLARGWDMAGVWDTTISAAESLLFEARTPWSLRLWARDLLCLRDRTVLENHIRRLASSFWALPPRRALRVSAQALVREVCPAPGESGRAKLARTSRAIWNPSATLSEHHRALERRAASFLKS